MNRKKRLTRDDIIGRKIVCVYEMKGSRIGRFQNTLTYVCLDTGTIFNLDELRDPKMGEPLNIWSCGHETAFVPVQSIDKKTNLNSPIKAIVYAPDFSNGTAILLDNDFVVAISIGEVAMGCSFYLPSKEFRDYIFWEIADGNQ